ncbi:MAG: amidohydrolase family protein [Candidatus Brocadiaceae bacterium]|nr:amidohydrolase family protein [Candidatus Brocadiaceae bacterium]
MAGIPLHHVWQYTDVDRAFWHEHLEGWVPERIIDAHTHVADPALRVEPVTDEMRRQYWVSEVNEPMCAEDAARCTGIVFPGRQVTQVAVGSPSLAFDIERANEALRRECLARGWHALTVCPPQWTAERVAEELKKPGVLGLKPYYTLIARDPTTRDAHLEASIFDFLPRHVLEAAEEAGAWITLHVPRAERLPHPDNLREIREIRRRYPNVVLVIAHLGRCYTEPHAREGLLPLAADPGLYFDNSAVLNPAVHRLALETIGPERILYGTDNPVFYMRGRRQWRGRSYVNRTSHPFHFNAEREPPEVEAGYTLYMYEALRALKDACRATGIDARGVQGILHDNAQRLIDRVLRTTHADPG